MFGDGLGTADLFGCVTCSVVEYVIDIVPAAIMGALGLFYILEVVYKVNAK